MALLMLRKRLLLRRVIKMVWLNNWVRTLAQLFLSFLDSQMKTMNDKCHLIGNLLNQTFLKIKNINDENSSCEKLLLVKVDSTLSFSKYSEDITKVACRVQNKHGKKTLKIALTFKIVIFPHPENSQPENSHLEYSHPFHYLSFFTKHCVHKWEKRTHVHPPPWRKNFDISKTN